jgi:ketosteroid isomerase-like protein
MSTQSSIKELTLLFAKYFTAKDVDGIGSLLTDNFSLFDPALKWLHGKKAVLDVLKKQFKETSRVSYEVENCFQDGVATILEFKITLDELILHGVDLIQWENQKMAELRCYYNPPDK